MKNLYNYILLACLLSSMSLTAQEIPNAGLENWEFINGWNYTPVDWTTQNSQLIETARIDSMSNSGDLAMKIYPTFDGIGEFGHAKTTFATTFIPPALNFHAKWEKTSTAGVAVDIIFYNDSTWLGSAYWSPSIDTSAWSSITLPIDIVYDEVTHAEIRVNIVIGDFAPGEGWISVDDFSFGIIDGVESFDQSQITIGPNPCDDVLTINANDINKGYDQMQIIDNTGRQVYSGKFQQTVNTSKLSDGIYFLRIETDSGILQERFQVIH